MNSSKGDLITEGQSEFYTAVNKQDGEPKEPKKVIPLPTNSDTVAEPASKEKPKESTKTNAKDDKAPNDSKPPKSIQKKPIKKIVEKKKTKQTNHETNHPTTVATVSNTKTEAEPKNLPTGTISFKEVSGVKDSYLTANGRKYRKGKVPIGSYKVFLMCSGNEKEPVRSYTISEGKHKDFICNCGFKTCD